HRGVPAVAGPPVRHGRPLPGGRVRHQARQGRSVRVRLVGLAGRQVTVGVVTGDTVAPLAEVTDFYADVPYWMEKARTAGPGEAPLAEAELAPPVPPSARVLCIGLN